MASIFLLYINDEVVGPSLNLIRKIGEPLSSSKPHVSVRGPIRRSRLHEQDWKDIRIRSVRLMNPGNFWSFSNDVSEQNTVFLECDFKELRQIWYKPDYPSSLPHVTLYDGRSREFAVELLDLLSQYTWGLTVNLAKECSKKTGLLEYPALTEVQIKRRRKSNNKTVKYDIRIQRLFADVTSKKLDFDYLVSLSEKARIDLIDAVCMHMMRLLRRREGRQFSFHKPIHEGNLFRATRRNVSESGVEERKDIATDAHSSSKDVSTQVATASQNPRTQRRKLGQFLTPPELAKDIARCVMPFMDSAEPIHFGDPAIGTGIFFSVLRETFPADRIASAIGCEIDASLAETARRIWANKGLRVLHQDFFRINLRPKRNLILSNPPYVRHHFISPEQKNELRKRVENDLGIRVSGLAGLYVYFILHCHDWMTDGAIASWLVPTEFMQSSYGAAIRRYLTEFVTLLRVHRFDPSEIQFDDVVVSSAVVIFRKCLPSGVEKVLFSHGGSLANPTQLGDVVISELRNSDKWPIDRGPCCRKDTPLFRLRDFFKIRRGVATGANDFFIMSRSRARELSIPESCLRPILPSPRKLLVDVIEGGADGYPDIDPQLALLDCELSGSDILRKCPKMWEYLSSAEGKGILRRYLVRKRRPWYKQERRDPAPFLCTYMGRRSLNGLPFRFVWNRSSAVGTNLYLMLYPRGDLEKLLEDRPSLHARVFDLLREIAVSALQERSRVYGGGLFKIEILDLGETRADRFTSLF